MSTVVPAASDSRLRLGEEIGSGAIATVARVIDPEDGTVYAGGTPGGEIVAIDSDGETRVVADTESQSWGWRSCKRATSVPFPTPLGPVSNASRAGA